MDIFHNLDKPNYERITGYGPKWLAEYLEMDANYKFAGWTLDLAAHFLNRIIENLSPETADEPTITMLERLMRIEYDSPDVLFEERRRTVCAYWYGIGKLNRTSIKNMVQKYTGCECTLRWNDSVLMISTLSSLDDDRTYKFEYSKLARILRRRMPAHLGFGLQNLLKGFEAENRNEVYLEKITYRLNIPWASGEYYLDGSWFLDGSVCLELRELNPVGMKIQAVMEAEERAEASLTTYVDWWTLDGSYCLDGGKQLKAEMRKEVL